MSASVIFTAYRNTTVKMFEPIGAYILEQNPLLTGLTLKEDLHSSLIAPRITEIELFYTSHNFVMRESRWRNICDYTIEPLCSVCRARARRTVKGFECALVTCGVFITAGASLTLTLGKDDTAVVSLLQECYQEEDFLESLVSARETYMVLKGLSKLAPNLAYWREKERYKTLF